MKVKKLKSKQILKLHLLSLKPYDYTVNPASSDLLTDVNLTQIISDFKKVLDVIFEYHQANKKILFVGLPSRLESKINKLTHHLAVDRNFELQKLTMNNSKSLQQFSTSEKHSLLKGNDNLLMKSFQKPDLVVLLAHEKKQSILVEKNLAKVPFIVFRSDESSRINIRNGFYNLTGFSKSLVSTSEKNLLFLGLNFIIKRFKK